MVIESQISFGIDALGCVQVRLHAQNDKYSGQ